MELTGREVIRLIVEEGEPFEIKGNIIQFADGEYQVKEDADNFEDFLISALVEEDRLSVETILGVDDLKKRAEEGIISITYFYPYFYQKISKDTVRVGELSPLQMERIEDRLGFKFFEDKSRTVLKEIVRLIEDQGFDVEMEFKLGNKGRVRM